MFELTFQWPNLQEVVHFSLFFQPNLIFNWKKTYPITFGFLFYRSCREQVRHRHFFCFGNCVREKEIKSEKDRQVKQQKCRRSV